MIAWKRVASLAKREYLPMLGSVVMWLLAAIAVGHAEAVRLLAGVALVRSVQLFTRLPTVPALRRRHGAAAEVRRQSQRRALWLQLASLAAGLAIMAVVVAGLAAAGQRHWAAIIGLLLAGYPARNLLQSQGQCNVRLFATLVPWSGAALVAAALWLDWRTYEIAVLIGLREWLAGLASLLWPTRGQPCDPVASGPLTFAEVAAGTGLRARRAFTYRLGRLALAAVLPGAGLLARTGRGFGLDRRLERIVPRHRPGFLLVALGAWLAAAIIVVVLPEPSLLLIAAMLARLAAAAGGALLWWAYLPTGDLADDEDDDD